MYTQNDARNSRIGRVSSSTVITTEPVVPRSTSRGVSSSNDEAPAFSIAALPKSTALTFSPYTVSPLTTTSGHETRSLRAAPAWADVGVMHRKRPSPIGCAGTSESPNHLSGVLLYAAFTHDLPNLH